MGPYRLLLELPQFGETVERVVVFGRPTLSRPVTRLVARPEMDVVLVSPYDGWPDPGRAVTRANSVIADPGDPGWLTAWRAAGAAATTAIDAILDGESAAGRLTGPLLARELWDRVRPGERLVAGSSNPIRDLDLAARPSPATELVPVVANRGVAGIDGTVSTATGLALAAGPVRVLLGDVTFLHDIGGLLLAPGTRRPPLQIVVLNDGGGGIFSLLEYGERAERGQAEAAVFDRVFGTPHAADLGALCQGYGVRHEIVQEIGRLRTVLTDPAPGTSVIEIRADRSVAAWPARPDSEGCPLRCGGWSIAAGRRRDGSCRQ